MSQIVTLPTRGNKILDVIITNLGNLYSTPVIHPPVPPDQPTHEPSDHSVPVAYPLSNQSQQCSKEYFIKKHRPLNDSGIREFGQWITHQSWDNLVCGNSPSDQVEKFQKM